MNQNNTLPPEKNLHSIPYLQDMYRHWFLDYASYVILERAVPHMEDGLKPVQRRILYAMKRLDDGRYNKVANVIGHTMQFHPHGDASIGDALVQLGQKELLIDTQGNWGNIHTGDSAAAPRYIEARLSKFALEVLFNPKTTNWKPSYDGRNQEPIALPIKFPLVLVQGSEGIAVGLSSKILPHNFIELIDASIAHLRNKPFELFPDFLTEGSIDVSRYNDGARGGNVRVRASIEKQNNKTLVINNLPFGKTAGSLIESILKANDKGKIKIKKVDDNTADKVEIIVTVSPNVSIDKTIDALYATTDCEISISPNACIIENDKPLFTGVSHILKKSVERTQALLTLELEIEKQELLEAWHEKSLEQWFIDERIYKEKEYEEASSVNEALEYIDTMLEPFKKNLKREVTQDDLKKLLEIRMKRILRFNTDEASALLDELQESVKRVQENLDNIVNYTIDYYKRIKKKYSKGMERRTEIKSFENIDLSNVVIANEKLYFNKEEGFVGTSLKKNQFISDCSDVDQIIIFYKDGRYIISKVQAKAYIGKNVQHIAIFKKNDNRTIYNVIYKDGETQTYFHKRFYVKGITLDKEYNLTTGTPKTKIVYFSANPNGEAETLKVVLTPKPRIKHNHLNFDFSETLIKGRDSKGNILTKHNVQRIVLKNKGGSTIGGVHVWFDDRTNRFNNKKEGLFLGEFEEKEQIIVFDQSGTYNLYSHGPSVRVVEENIALIEKFNPEKSYTIVYYDADKQLIYVKRFVCSTTRDIASLIGDNKSSKMLCLSSHAHPCLKVTFKGKHKSRPPEIIQVDNLIDVKSHRHKGVRLSRYDVQEVVELLSAEKSSINSPKEETPTTKPNPEGRLF